MDCTKRHLHAVDINKRHWEEMAHDRSAWSMAVKNGAPKAETKIATDAEIKRQRRYERALALANHTNQQPQFACRYCGRKLAARIGQLSHESLCEKKLNDFAMLSYSKPRSQVESTDDRLDEPPMASMARRIAKIDALVLTCSSTRDWCTTLEASKTTECR